jgi:hypothetical protein
MIIPPIHLLAHPAKLAVEYLLVPGVKRGVRAVKEHRTNRNQAELRPRLKVVCGVERLKSSEEGILWVKVSNSGKGAAHTVHGQIAFHKDFFGPPKPHPLALRAMTGARAAVSHSGMIFEADNSEWHIVRIFDKNKELIGSSPRKFNILVTLKRTGKTPIGCHVVCSEGATFDGPIWVEVPGTT